MRIENKRDAPRPPPSKHVREGRTAGRGETQTADNRNGAEARKPSTRAVLTSSRNRAVRADERARQGMTARTHTYNIRATAQSRTNRTTHEMERPSDERRHGYNGASKQSTPSRQNRKPPPPSVSDGWRGTTQGKQARGTRQAERETNSTAASALLPAHRVARRGERRRTDPTDVMIDEARDETR